MGKNESNEKAINTELNVLNAKPVNNESPESISAQQMASSIHMSKTDLARYIDHTMLKPEAVEAQFVQLCDEAVEYNFKSVCVNSSWVPFVAKRLKNSGIVICSVIGFPLGAMDTRSKAFEAGSAIESGATELDMVINLGALKSGNLKMFENDIRETKLACGNDALLKVILETGLLTDTEKILACKIAQEAGADFVKTSTGFAGSGATVADIELMRRTVGLVMGVKASGGIKTFEQAVAMIKAGASRLGCGASVAIITGAESQGNY